VPGCSDAEVLTLALVRHLLGRPSKRAFLAEVRRDWRHFFPVLPAQSEFNRRVRWLWGAFELLRQAVLRGVPEDAWQQVDTTAVPVKHPSRVRGAAQAGDALLPPGEGEPGVRLDVDVERLHPRDARLEGEGAPLGHVSFPPSTPCAPRRTGTGIDPLCIRCPDEESEVGGRRQPRRAQLHSRERRTQIGQTDVVPVDHQQ
jgi:hypothetical protein